MAVSSEELLHLLSQCKLCRIGYTDGEGSAIVPMSFGYCLEDGKLQLYFHSRQEGRKTRAFRENPRVCFEMEGECRLTTRGSDTLACNYSYCYVSAMGEGTVTFLEGREQKRQGLELLTEHQCGRRLPIAAEKMDCVAVFKLTVEKLSVKHHGK